MGTGLALCFMACGLPHRPQQDAASVASAKTAAERDFYREQAAALAAMVTRERKLSYAEGLLDGRAAVVCIPTWKMRPVPPVAKPNKAPEPR